MMMIQHLIMSAIAVGLTGSGCAAFNKWKDPDPNPKFYTVTRPMITSGSISKAEVTNTGVVFEIEFECSRRRVGHYCVPTDESCSRKPEEREPEEVECGDAALKGASLEVRAPWGATFPGRGNETSTVFDIEWNKVTLDALEAATEARLREAWVLQGAGIELSWKPSASDVELLVQQLAQAQAIDIEVKPESRPVELEVKALAIEGRPLAPGRDATLVLTVGNLGPGVAYKVVARTRSGVAALHDLQFSFGKLEPGEQRLRRVTASIPADIKDTSAMVVVSFQEANSGGHKPFNQRLAIATASATTRAAPAPDKHVILECHPGADGKAVSVEPGKTAMIQCKITNEGARSFKQAPVVVVHGGAKATVNVDIPAKGSASVVVAIPVPQSTKVGSNGEFKVSLTAGSETVQSMVITKVAKDDGCHGKKWTRDEYKKKRARLQEAVSSGGLTKEEFDQYDAALVLCLE